MSIAFVFGNFENDDAHHLEVVAENANGEKKAMRQIKKTLLNEHLAEAASENVAIRVEDETFYLSVMVGNVQINLVIRPDEERFFDSAKIERC